MIPRIIHYVWVGSPLPIHQQVMIDTWRTTNPRYEIMAWTEDTINFSQPMLRKAYDERKWATVADIVRLMAVAQHGGIYLDTDVKMFAPLDRVLIHKCFFAFQQQKQSSEWVGNAVFGAEVGDRFIQEALDRLLKMKRKMLGIEKPTRYGPRLITQLLVEQGLSNYSSNGVKVGDVFVYPTQVFYPYHWKENFTNDKIKADTIGAHIWSETPSWMVTIHPAFRIIHSSKRAIRSSLKRVFQGRC